MAVASCYTGRMDAQLDPTTGDYTGNRISHLGNAVYIRLMTPLGGWWADTSLGSRLHELQREKDLPRIHILARQYAEQALQPLIDSGRATSITVTTEQPHDGRCIMLIEVVDTTGTPYTFRHFVKVGG